MSEHRIFSMPFAEVYPHYVNKAERKGRTKAEVHEIITWLTGYSDSDIAAVVDNRVTFRDFFAQAPAMNANRELITGSVCGVKVQEIEDDLMREIRYVDKLIDELARGKKMESILRAG